MVYPVPDSPYSRDGAARDSAYSELERARTATGYLLGVYEYATMDNDTPEGETDWTSPPDTATRGDAADASSDYFATAGKIVRSNPITSALVGVAVIASTILLIRSLK